MSVFVARPKRDIKESVRAIFHNYREDLDFSKGILLKPNIVFPMRPKSGQVTPPHMVRAVIEVLREAHPDIEIIIGEGTAAGTDPIENFKISGYASMARKLGVTLLDFDQADRVELQWKYGTLEIPQIVFDKTYISLPILKASSAAVMSGAMKNQKGLLTPSMKKKFHRWGLHGPIAELSQAVRPSITIMDGSSFFRGNVLIAGNNLYEMDKLVAELLDLGEPEYLKEAEAYESREADHRIEGYDLLQPKAIKRGKEAFKKFLGMRFWTSPRACSMCRMCLNHLLRLQVREIGRSFPIYGKLAQYAVKGADFVFGLRPQFEPKSRNVVCFGDCTKELAHENGYLHIPGCPPTKEGILKHLCVSLHDEILAQDLPRVRIK